MLTTEDRILVQAMAGVSAQDAAALLRILTIVGLKRRGAKIAPLVGIINDAYDNAVKIIKGLKLKEELFLKLCREVKSPEKTSANAMAFAQEFRAAASKARLTHDTETFNGDMAQMLPPVMTLLTSPDSASAFANVQKNISKLGAADLTKAYSVFTAESVGNVKALMDKLIAAGKAITKRPTMKLTTAQRAKAKGTEELKNFNKIAALLKVRVQAEIRNIVSALGEKKATCMAVSAELEKRSIPNPYHKGFWKQRSLFINLDGAITDKFGNVADVQGGGVEYDVVVNKEYDPKAKGKTWLFYFHDKAEDRIIGKRAYAASTVQKKKGASFVKIANVAEKLEGYKKKWRADMMRAGDIEGEAKVYGATAELLYWTGLRPSTGTGLSGGQATFGATSFQVRHVAVGGDKKVDGSEKGSMFKATFLVKGGKPHTFILNANDENIPDDEKKYVKGLIALLIAKCAKKKPTDVVMTVAGDRMNAQFFNRYIKAKGMPFTGKDFRTFRGTQVAMEILPQAKAAYDAAAKKNGGKPLAATEVHKIFNAALTKVGARLGHKRGTDDTHVTAVKYYVDPNVMVGWYNDVGYQPQAIVQKAAKAAGIAV